MRHLRGQQHAFSLPQVDLPGRVAPVLEWLPPRTELVFDVTSAAWVVERLAPWDPSGARLESFAPGGFDAYARVFNPLRRGPSDQDVGTRWADLAEARGMSLFPDITLSKVLGLDAADQATYREEIDRFAPLDGELPAQTCAALARLLRAHTATAETCWYCVWEGYGALRSSAHASLSAEPPFRTESALRQEAAEEQDALLASVPKVLTRSRRYLLFTGPLDVACGFEPSGSYLSPNLWWPDDRSWIVVTEIDGYSTYVGGSRAAIDEIVTSPDVEAIEVSLEVHMDPGPYPPRWR